MKICSSFELIAMRNKTWESRLLVFSQVLVEVHPEYIFIEGLLFILLYYPKFMCLKNLFSFIWFWQQAVKQLLVPVLPKFVEAFLEALQSSDDAVTDTGIKTDIMKALTVLLKSVPSHMGAHFKSIVMCIWQLLVNSSELYPLPTILDNDS